eukprot:4990489-Prymnesium_polylepis.1
MSSSAEHSRNAESWSLEGRPREAIERHLLRRRRAALAPAAREHRAKVTRPDGQHSAVRREAAAVDDDDHVGEAFVAHHGGEAGMGFRHELEAAPRHLVVQARLQTALHERRLARRLLRSDGPRRRP